MKKILLSLGTTFATFTPIALTISCVSEHEEENTEISITPEKIPSTEKLYTQKEFQIWNLDKKIVYSTQKNGNIDWFLGNLYNKKVLNPNLMFITNENYKYTNDFKIKLCILHLEKNKNTDISENFDNLLQFVNGAAEFAEKIWKNTENIKGFILVSWNSLPKNTFLREGSEDLFPDEKDYIYLRKWYSVWSKKFDKEIKKIKAL